MQEFSFFSKETAWQNRGRRGEHRAAMDDFGSIPEGGDKATDRAGPPASRSPVELGASSAQPTLRGGRREAGQGGGQEDEADAARSAQSTLRDGSREDGQGGVQEDDADVAIDAAGDVPCLDTDAQGGDSVAAAAGAAGPRALTSADVRGAARRAANAAFSGAALNGFGGTAKVPVRTRRRAVVPPPSWAMGGRRRQGMGGSAGVAGVGGKVCECCGVPGHDQVWREEMFELNFLRP